MSVDAGYQDGGKTDLKLLYKKVLSVFLYFESDIHRGCLLVDYTSMRLL